MSRAPFENVKRLLAFFQAHPNETFTSEQIRAATGIPEGSLHGTFRVLRTGHKQAVQPSRGLYRWDQPKSLKPSPSVPPAPEPLPIHAGPAAQQRQLFEMIGTTSDGKVVLQSEAGDLFLAHKL